MEAVAMVLGQLDRSRMSAAVMAPDNQGFQDLGPPVQELVVIPGYT
jgi:hypothetical protein